MARCCNLWWILSSRCWREMLLFGAEEVGVTCDKEGRRGEAAISKRLRYF